LGALVGIELDQEGNHLRSPLEMKRALKDEGELNPKFGYAIELTTPCRADGTYKLLSEYLINEVGG